MVLTVLPSAVARFNENGSRDSTYADAGKVPVNQMAFVAGHLTIAPDGSAFVSALTFNALFQQVLGIYHIFGDARPLELGFAPLPGGWAPTYLARRLQAAAHGHTAARELAGHGRHFADHGAHLGHK